MKLYFPKTWIIYSPLKLERIFLCKVYHIYTERNEWVNWYGDTGLVDRTRRSFFLDFRSCKKHAENNRIQGTRFIVDEVPSICMELKFELEGKGRSIICTELYNSCPFSDKKIDIEGLPLSVKDVMTSLEGDNWFCYGVYHGDASCIERADRNSTFFRWMSKPSKGGRKVPLAWITHRDKISQKGILNILSEMNRKIRVMRRQK